MCHCHDHEREANRIGGDQRVVPGDPEAERHVRGAGHRLRRHRRNGAHGCADVAFREQPRAVQVSRLIGTSRVATDIQAEHERVRCDRDPDCQVKPGDDGRDTADSSRATRQQHPPGGAGHPPAPRLEQRQRMRRPQHETAQDERVRGEDDAVARNHGREGGRQEERRGRSRQRHVRHPQPTRPRRRPTGRDEQRPYGQRDERPWRRGRKRLRGWQDEEFHGATREAVHVRQLRVLDRPLARRAREIETVAAGYGRRTRPYQVESHR